MTARVLAWAAAALATIVVGGCAVAGTPTWPGARLAAGLLTAADFPPGVQFDRITDQPGSPDGQGGPPAMLSKPEGCSDGLTRVIAASAERGPGSAAKFSVAYDGARIVMTVLTSTLDLDELAGTAQRCEQYLTYFDEASPAIPVTTTKLPSERADSLVYRQTLRLMGSESSVFFAFENVGNTGMFAIAFPTPAPSIPVKATLPQTFLDLVAKQSERLSHP